jgi:prepilin peptidase CpaA
MSLFALSNWPLLFICGAMIASAVIDWWKFKVPNRLTFPIILSGWAFGLLHTFGVHLVANDGDGGIGASLAGTALGFALLLPMYAIGGMGAGDVKMTMGFGAWAGAFFGLEGNLCLWVILYAFCAGAISGGIIAVFMIGLRREFRQNLQHTRAILIDLVASGGNLATIAQKANERRPRWHRLPYGVPLCIGFVGYLCFAGVNPRSAVPPTNEAPVQQVCPYTAGTAVCLNVGSAVRTNPVVRTADPTGV